jgi:uncharacterized membrane protein
MAFRNRYDLLTAAMIGAGVIGSVMLATGANVRLVSPALGLLVGLVLPTRLLAKALDRRAHGLGTRLPLALALTVLALMVGGLVLNTVLPWLGDPHPLSSLPVLGFVDAFNAAIIIGCPRCLRAAHVRRAPLGGMEKLAIGLTVSGLVLAVAGTVRLNNDAGGGLAEFALALTAAAAFVLLSRPKDIRRNVIMLCLYGIGLAVLYQTSLRGWYTTGHDIQVEFRTFLLVHQAQRWSVGAAGTAYNACLSITILPQMLWQLTRVATPYVYKVDFPLMFAAAPVALFEMSWRMFGRRLGVASVLLFIAFPTFVDDIVFLNRQEVAFLFVSVILGLAFSGGANLNARRALIGCCLAGMALAHYSTSYVFLGTLAIAAIGLAASKTVCRLIAAARLRRGTPPGRIAGLARRSAARAHKRPVVFNWALLGLACLLVGSWSFVEVHASSQFSTDLHQIADAAMGTSGGAKSNDVNYSALSSGSGASASAEMAQWRLDEDQLAGTDRVKDGFYPSPVVDKYATPPAPALRSPLTAVGRGLSTAGVSAYELNSVLRDIIARLLQICAVLGAAVLLLGWKRSPRMSAEYAYVALGSLVLLVGTVVLPTMSVDYGLLRMFQQALFVLAPLIVVGASFVLRPLWNKTTDSAVCALVGVCFVSLTGLLPQITGGYVPQLNLNNAGEYYENYYTQPQEISAVKWLNTANCRCDIVQADPFASARFLPYATFQIDANNYPTAVYRTSYVIMGADTATSGTSTAGPDGDLVDFIYPVGFLAKYKDLIYSNGDAQIFGGR